MKNSSVAQHSKGYEERLYPPSTWVTTRIKHSNRDEVALLTFMKLFDYINEANVAKVKIPMTTPISMLAEPASGPDCTQTFTLSFYIPSALAKSPPTPLNPDVFVEQRPEVRVLVR